MSSAYTLKHGSSFVDAACLDGDVSDCPITAQVSPIVDPTVIFAFVDQHCTAAMLSPISWIEPTPAVSLEPHDELIIC